MSFVVVSVVRFNGSAIVGLNHPDLDPGRVILGGQLRKWSHRSCGAFWCRIVWDSVIVNLSLWEIISDLAVANLGMENHGIESLWAAPASLTEKAHT